MKELGRRADLSHPFLSQLERGLARPSLGSVERIAQALDVPVGRLWSDPGRRGATEVIRADQGAVDPSAPGRRRTVAAVGDPAVVREWTGGPRKWPADAVVEDGEVLLYVARGGVEVELQGEVHALAEGDALLFDGGVPHRVRRTGGTATRALCVAIAPA